MITNQVTLVGFVGTNPEFRKTKSEQLFVKFSLATHESWKDKDGSWQNKTHWHRVTVWGEDMATVIFENIHKGDRVRLEGKLKSNEWTDKDGKKRTAYEIVLSKLFGSCLIIPSFKKDKEEIIETEEAEFLYESEEAIEAKS